MFRVQHALGCFTASCSLLLGGCSADDAQAPRFVSELEWKYGAPSSEPAPDDDAHAQQRLACAYDAPSHTSASLGEVPSLSRLKHVVLLMMENRSFDHYFSSLEGHPQLRDDDVAHGETNPDGHGGVIARFAEPRLCVRSPGHEWNDSHLQYAAGQNSGFVAVSNPGGGRAMGYYTEQEIPFYHWLAKSYAMSSRHFSSLLGPTQPNRLFYFLGTSCGFADDLKVNKTVASCAVGRPSIFTRLDEADVDFEIYDASKLATLVVALGVRVLPVPKEIEDFEQAARDGKLPALSIVGASTGEWPGRPGNDDHGPFNPQLGQLFVARIIRALASNEELWKDSALIISYDEHGGYYDHVPPPKACNPGAPKQRDYEFDQYGFRVPLLVISPWAKAGYVSRHDTDHTSILRFVEHWQDLPALTKRDANAWPLLDLFDFDQDPLPPPTIDDELLALTPETPENCPPGGATGVPD
jgi:phospholipase C